MMNITKSVWSVLLFILLLSISPTLMAKKKTTPKAVTDREVWCDVMYRMAAPVLSNMSQGQLQQNMMVELSPTWDGRNKNVTYMEKIGRASCRERLYGLV